MLRRHVAFDRQVVANKGVTPPKLGVRRCPHHILAGPCRLPSSTLLAPFVGSSRPGCSSVPHALAPRAAGVLPAALSCRLKVRARARRASAVCLLAFRAPPCHPGLPGLLLHLPVVSQAAVHAAHRGAARLRADDRRPAVHARRQRRELRAGGRVSRPLCRPLRRDHLLSSRRLRVSGHRLPFRLPVPFSAAVRAVPRYVAVEVRPDEQPRAVGAREPLFDEQLRLPLRRRRQARPPSGRLSAEASVFPAAVGAALRFSA